MNDHSFVFGTQYLRGASPAKDQWDRDMDSMKRLGFNTIRAWLVWNACERYEGEIDFDYITSFLNCARAHELDVGVLFHMHACPAWAVEKYSKYFYVSEDNLPFEPAVRANTPSGGWPGLCFDNDEVREMEERFIRGVIGETSKYENVAFYEPMNEPHQWVDMTRSPNGMYCYCPATTRKFRQWLKVKYGDISALNAAWGHFYGSFDEVRPPRWISAYSDYTDFRLFTMDNVAEEIAFRARVIRDCDTKPVIAHAWGGGAITCAQLGGMAFDDWKNAKVFDKWGFSAFPRDAKSASTLAMGCDATRCAADGKEFWQSELTAGMWGTGLHQGGRMDDDTFLNLSLESIRHGAKGLLYWQFRKERFGAEFGGYAMTDYDGGPTNLSRCAGRLGEMLKRNGDVLSAGALPRAEVAVLFSIRSYLAVWLSNGRHENKAAIDAVNGYYRVLWEENIPVDILHEDFFGDLSGYRLIILPCACAVSPAFAEALKTYIAGGGTVLSDPYFGAFDKDMQLSYAVPGYGFAEIFGAREDDIREGDAREIVYRSETHRVTGLLMNETFRDVAADALATYADGTPAILSHRWGRGRAILSGVSLGNSCAEGALISDDILADGQNRQSTLARRVVLDLCADCGVRPNPCDAPGVKASVYETDDGNGCVILINSAAEPAEGRVRLNASYAACSEELGAPHASLADNALRFRLAPHESAVIRLLAKR